MSLRVDDEIILQIDLNYSLVCKFWWNLCFKELESIIFYPRFSWFLWTKEGFIYIELYFLICMWRLPSLSGLTPIVFNTGLTHLDLEASNYVIQIKFGKTSSVSKIGMFLAMLFNQSWKISHKCTKFKNYFYYFIFQFTEFF